MATIGRANKKVFLPERNYNSPDWASYTLTLAVNTWTRLTDGAGNKPQIVIPALGAPLLDTQWAVEVYGFMRLNPASVSATTIYFGVQINNGAMGSVHGGGLMSTTGPDLKPVRARITPPNYTNAFNIDFSIYSNAAQNVTIISNPSPVARAYLIPV